MEVRRRPRAPPFLFPSAASDRSRAVRARAFIGWAGGSGVAGHAVNPSLEARGRLARLCSPAQTARPGLGVLPNPSGACAGPMAPNGPATPLPPAPDTSLVLSEKPTATAPCSAEVVVACQSFLRWAACVRRADQSYRQSFGNRPHLLRQLPVPGLLAPVASLAHGHRSTVGGGAGWDCGTVGRHGWRSRAYRDVLAACPASPPSPAQPVARANQGFALCALQASKKTLTRAATATHCRR